MNTHERRAIDAVTFGHPVVFDSDNLRRWYLFFPRIRNWSRWWHRTSAVEDAHIIAFANVLDTEIVDVYPEQVLN